MLNIVSWGRCSIQSSHDSIRSTRDTGCATLVTENLGRAGNNGATPPFSWKEGNEEGEKTKQYGREDKNPQWWELVHERMNNGIPKPNKLSLLNQIMNIKIMPYYTLYLHLLKESKNKIRNKPDNAKMNKQSEIEIMTWVILILSRKEMSNVSCLSTQTGNHLFLVGRLVIQPGNSNCWVS